MGQTWGAWLVAVAGASIALLAASCGLSTLGKLAPGDAGTDDAHTSSRDGTMGGPDGGDASPGDASSDVFLRDASGCDADLQTSGTHCGACGHDCLGGACMGGACQPVAFASGLDEVEGLAIDSANVYFSAAGAGRVYQCPLAGCGGAPTLLASGQNTPNSMAVTATAVYWTSHGGEVSTCPIGGGSVLSVADLSGDLAQPMGRMFIEGATVFFTYPAGSQVFSCPIAGCGGGPTLLATTSGAPYGIVSDGTSVYWVDSTLGSLSSCAVADCSASQATLVTGESNPKTLVIDGTTLYWSDLVANGSIRSCSLGACAATVATVAGNQSSPQGVAVDASRVYWTNNADGTIWSADRSGGNARMLAMGPSQPWAIAVSANAIYWTLDTTSGGVMMLAK